MYEKYIYNILFIMLTQNSIDYNCLLEFFHWNTNTIQENIKQHLCTIVDLARGFGSVVKHSTADPGIASLIPSLQYAVLRTTNRNIETNPPSLINVGSWVGLCRYIDKPICTGFLQYDTVRLSVSRRIDTKGSNSN